MLFPMETIRYSIEIMDEEESHLEQMNMETIKIRHAVKEDLEDIDYIQEQNIRFYFQTTPFQAKDYGSFCK